MKIQVKGAARHEEHIRSVALAMNRDEASVLDRFGAIGANHEVLSGNLDVNSDQFIHTTRRLGYFLEGQDGCCQELELNKADADLLSRLVSMGILADLCASRHSLANFNAVRPHQTPLSVERGLKVARAVFSLTYEEAKANLGLYNHDPNTLSLITEPTMDQKAIRYMVNCYEDLKVGQGLGQ
ncbi:MAG TPA: hypothetical protein VF733_00045 [Candidatus Saccharimonadales bacterium]